LDCALRLRRSDEFAGRAAARKYRNAHVGVLLMGRITGMRYALNVGRSFAFLFAGFA